MGRNCRGHFWDHASWLFQLRLRWRPMPEEKRFARRWRMIRTVLFSVFATALALFIFLAPCSGPAPVAAAQPAATSAAKPAPKVSKEGQSCLNCHGQMTVGIVKDWQGSKHVGAGVDCYTCPGA